MTIIEAIRAVLEEEGKPLSHKAIYDRIVSKNYYSFGAKDPISVVRGKLRKHCYGLDFPSASPRKIFIESGLRGKKPLYSLWDGSNQEKSEIVLTDTELLTEEVIYEKYNEHIASLKAKLLDELKSADPSFFENLVVKLLLKMGYGWHGSLAGSVLGGSGDNGIDGIISEDKLGLEKIYIQAKRYNNKKVPSNEIRDFAGAMVMRGARKGVFFSTSDYTVGARRSAEEAQGMNITLLNGDQLSELLVQHNMGVAKVTSYDIYEIDKNFFEDKL